MATLQQTRGPSAGAALSPSRPSLPSFSHPGPDTLYASDLSDLQTASLHPVSSPVEGASRVQKPSLSFRARAETLASNSSPSSVRRKPLPSTASPVATRFSIAQHRISTFELPEQPYARRFTADSPTLYEHPPIVESRFSTAPPSRVQSIIK